MKREKKTHVPHKVAYDIVVCLRYLLLLSLFSRRFFCVMRPSLHFMTIVYMDLEPDHFRVKQKKTTNLSVFFS